MKKRENALHSANPDNTSDGQSFFDEVQIPRGCPMPSEMFLAELKEQYNCELKWSKVKEKILIMADSKEISQNGVETLRRGFGLRPVTQTAVRRGLDHHIKTSTGSNRSSERPPVKPALSFLVKKNDMAHLRYILNTSKCFMSTSDVDGEVVITS